MSCRTLHVEAAAAGLRGVLLRRRPQQMPCWPLWSAQCACAGQQAMNRLWITGEHLV